MSWHPVREIITTGVSSPIADIDVSAYTGAQRVLVILKATATSGTGTFEVGTYASGYGCNSSVATVTKDVLQVAAFTNASGVIQNITSSGGTYTVELVGWADAFVESSPPIIFGPGLVGISWVNLDVSAHVVTNKNLAFIRWLANSGGGSGVQTRKDTYTDNQDEGVNTALINSGGDTDALIACPVDNDLLEIRNNVAGLNSTLYLEAHVDATQGWLSPDTNVYPAALPPASWTELDLSSVVGAYECLVCLRVSLPTVSAVLQQHAFREPWDVGSNYLNPNPNGQGTNCCRQINGDSAYVLVATDPNGKVEWINDSPDQTVAVDVIGYCRGPAKTLPVWDQETPTGVTLERGIIGGRATDIYGFDTSTLNLVATPVTKAPINIITNGVIQSGWDGSIVELNDVGNGPKEVLVNINSWPDGLTNGSLYNFEATMYNRDGETI